MLMSNGKGPSDQDEPTIGRSTLSITLAFLECYIYHHISVQRNPEITSNQKEDY